LVQAGIGEVEVAPKHPVNIQCAQLCGLGHYRMLGQMQILEPEAFAAWEKESSAEDEFFDEDEFDDEDEDRRRRRGRRRRGRRRRGIVAAVCAEVES
jgi:hypothetical protein